MSAARARGGQLVVENVALLAGGARSFEDRYKVPLADDSFRAPGNVKTAYPLLHFLLCSIDPDTAPNAFKPCFPIMDREQERDFRKVVDANLAILERGKLIPPGVARKSVIASAGGDKFEQLMWTLSTVALQQAALRHPAHATAHSLVPNPPQLVGDGQNRRYAALLRTRIASERAAFARTTQMGRDASLRWAAEVQELRDRIAAVEAKATFVKKELEELGFDERGVDLRARETEKLTLEREAFVEKSKGPMTPQMTSLAKPLLMKSSPIDSDESASLEDADPRVRSEAEELTQNLNRLLAFSKEPPGLGREAEKIVNRIEKMDDGTLGTDISSSLRPRNSASDDTYDASAVTKPCSDIADLVQAAVEELEKATSRMNLIASQRTSVISDISRDPSLENDLTAEGAAKLAANSALNEDVEKSLSLHQAIVNSTNSLAQSASDVARDAMANSELLDKEGSESKLANAKDSHDLTENLFAVSRVSAENDTPPEWVAAVEVMDEYEDTELFESDSTGKLQKVSSEESLEKMEIDTPPPGDEPTNETEGIDANVNQDDDLVSTQALQSKMDFFSTVEDLQKATEVVQTAREGPPPPARAPKPKKSTLRKAGGLALLTRMTSDEWDTSIPFHKVPMSKFPKRKKAGAKTVRFAELPPSYTASKLRQASSAPLQEPPPRSTLNEKELFGDEFPLPGGVMSQLLARRPRDVSITTRSPTLPLDDDDFVSPTDKVTVINSQPSSALFNSKPLQRRPTPRHLARRAAAIRSARTDSSSFENGPKISLEPKKVQTTPSPAKTTAANVAPDAVSQSKPQPTSPPENEEAVSELLVPTRANSTPVIEIEEDNVSITSSSENVTQLKPRRSMSTPGRFPSHSQPQPTNRLISFPSLHGFRKNHDKDKSAARRSSLVGDDDRFFSWLGGDRKSTTAGDNGGSPFSSNGRPVRSPSRIFSTPSRLSSVLSRKNTGGPGSSSRRERREREKDKDKTSGTPRQSRVKSLRARLAALI